MKTFTAAVTINNETFTMRELTSAKIKQLRKDGYTVVVNTVAPVAKPLSFFYRGEQVEIVEEVTNGYTLVNFTDGSRFFFHANTVEIEAR